MGLLDLPVELLRPIIRDVVRRPPWTNTDVISLARVNTVFEFEVFLILEDIHFLTSTASRPSSAFDLHPEYAAFVARYLLLRPYGDGARWNDHFPALVDAVVDAIIRLRPQTAPLRSHMVTTLCRKAALHLLVRKTVGAISRRDFSEHLLVAATLLGQLPVLAGLLAQNTDLGRVHSDFFGSPVQAAIQIDDANLVRRFLLHGAAFEYRGWLTDVVRAPHASRLLAVLASHKKVQAVLRTSIRDVTDAIACAVERDKQDVAIVLLRTQEAAFGHGCMGYYLRKAVLEACTRGMVALLLLLIEAGGFARSSRWTGPNLRYLLVATCSAGQAGSLRVLLEQTRRVQSEVLEGVLVEAAKTGTPGVLRVLLDHGVRLSSVEAFKLLASVAPWGSAESDSSTSSVLQRIVFLLEHKAVTLEALLAVEAHTGFGAAHLMMVAAQRGNFALLAALTRFGVPLDDCEFYAKAGCAVPVVAAEAYGRGETAVKVRVLVAEREIQVGKAVAERDKGMKDDEVVESRLAGEATGNIPVALATATCGNGSRVRTDDRYPDDW